VILFLKKQLNENSIFNQYSDGAITSAYNVQTNEYFAKLKIVYSKLCWIIEWTNRHRPRQIDGIRPRGRPGNKWKDYMI